MVATHSQAFFMGLHREFSSGRRCANNDTESATTEDYISSQLSLSPFVLCFDDYGDRLKLVFQRPLMILVAGRWRMKSVGMIDDNDLGFFANFLGVFIFVLVIAYHYVVADPKYEGN
ncbi:hypothetical protein L195_g006736 [Trifolium pratense]|uniref:Dolichyl-diphosphooligosaccharide--protein glycosyltransferase subunit 4 n=1 Tax=Trifolium pratense TaxID=57577 RepID=A0A2K3P4F7_TRIPR|nr:hypothetical protein L195_g006736 [Trifolium pratense]